LVETFVFGQTVDLAAEGFGLVQQLEAEWGIGYEYCLHRFSSIRKGELSLMGGSSNSALMASFFSFMNLQLAAAEVRYCAVPSRQLAAPLKFLYILNG
jgi:hypothetical protein